MFVSSLCVVKKEVKDFHCGVFGPSVILEGERPKIRGIASMHVSTLCLINTPHYSPRLIPFFFFFLFKMHSIGGTRDDEHKGLIGIDFRHKRLIVDR